VMTSVSTYYSDLDMIHVRDSDVNVADLSGNV
jgi:hypothetical protein